MGILAGSTQLGVTCTQSRELPLDRHADDRGCGDFIRVSDGQHFFAHRGIHADEN